MKKIIIFGNKGFLGFELFNYLSLTKKYNVIGVSREEIDLMNFSQLYNFLHKEKPNYVINCCVKGGRRQHIMTKEDFKNNIMSVNNLIKCKFFYGKLILFSSGAAFNKNKNIDKELEFDRKKVDYNYIFNELYGFSKFINDAIALQFSNNKVINLRLFNIFSRIGMRDSFIHTSIDNYIHMQPINIWEDRQFDFFSFSDLLKVILHFIENPPKIYTEINCCYKKKYFLEEVANIINNLDSYKVPIYIKKDCDLNYTGNADRVYELGIKFDGLTKSIRKIYNYKLIDNKI